MRQRGRAGRSVLAAGHPDEIHDAATNTWKPGADYVEVYAFRAPGEPVEIRIGYHGDPEVRYTPAEARKLVDGLRSVLDQIGQGSPVEQAPAWLVRSMDRLEAEHADELAGFSDEQIAECRAAGTRAGMAAIERIYAGRRSEGTR